jgi:hypothetical protein
MKPRAPEMKTFEGTRVFNPDVAMHPRKHKPPHMTGRRFRQHDGCHAGEVVHVVGEAPHFAGYWLVEAECGKRWAMRERVLHARLRECG